MTQSHCGVITLSDSPDPRGLVVELPYALSGFVGQAQAGDLGGVLAGVVRAKERWISTGELTAEATKCEEARDFQVVREESHRLSVKRGMIADGPVLRIFLFERCEVPM